MLSRHQCIVQLREAGQAMLSAARNGEWEHVGDLRERFFHAAQAVCAGKPGPQEQADMASAIREALEVNREAMSLCQAEYDERAARAGGLTRGRSAVLQYSRNRGK
jgi:hypothetical protein